MLYAVSAASHVREWLTIDCVLSYYRRPCRQRRVQQPRFCPSTVVAHDVHRMRPRTVIGCTYHIDWLYVHITQMTRWPNIAAQGYRDLARQINVYQASLVNK